MDEGNQGQIALEPVRFYSSHNPAGCRGQSRKTRRILPVFRGILGDCSQRDSWGKSRDMRDHDVHAGCIGIGVTVSFRSCSKAVLDFIVRSRCDVIV